MPRAIFVVLAAVVVFVALAMYMGGRVKSKFLPAPEVISQKSGGAVPAPVSTSVSTLAENPLQYVTDFSPRHIDHPESAPAYDALRAVKVFPQIVGCIKTSKMCKCISQQGTDVQVTLDRCLAILANKVFDPYREPREPRAPEVVASVGDGQRPAAGRKVAQDVGHVSAPAMLPAPGG